MEINNSSYIPKCLKCGEIIKFKLNYEKLCISVECMKGHNIRYLPIEDFKINYIKKSNIYKCKCFNCFKIINDIDNSNDYKCQICNKLFCQICITKHNKKEKHYSKIKFIEQNKICKNHNKIYSFFCETCKINICKDCKNAHKSHCLKSFLDILPNNKEKESIKKKLNIFKNKVQNLINSINEYKEEIINRFKEIKKFLEYLPIIIEELLINYNLNYFNYYNFENYNYLLNILNNKEVLAPSKYLDYLTLKDGIIKEMLNKNVKKGEEKNINYILNFDKLKYFKDNLFYIYDLDQYFKFFEFKNYSFESLLSFNVKKDDIYEIKPAKYSNYIFLNMNYLKKIKIYEYNLDKKTVKLTKKEIKDDNDNENYTHFNSFFDNENGNVITKYNKEIIIWKNEEKKIIL